MTIVLPDLGGAELRTQAGFGQFNAQYLGVLGHHGFLDEIEIKFCRGDYFEIFDNESAPVTQLRGL